MFEDERFSRLTLELETGSQFGLNDSNTNTLIKAWGHDTDDWISKEVELSLGHYTDWSSKSDPPEQKETVKVRAISPGKNAPPANGTGTSPQQSPLPPSRVVGGVIPHPSLKDDLDDTIPFALAFFIVSAVAWLAAGGSSLIA